MIILVMTGMMSCFSYKELQVKEVQSVKVLNQTDSTADVEVALKIHNPNKMKIVVRDGNLDAYINKKLIGNVDVDKKIEIPKKSEETYTFLLKTNMLEVKKLMPSLMFSNKALLGFKGDIKVKAKGISKTVKVDREERVSKKDLKNFNFSSNE